MLATQGNSDAVPQSPPIYLTLVFGLYRGSHAEPRDLPARQDPQTSAAENNTEARHKHQPTPTPESATTARPTPSPPQPGLALAPQDFGVSCMAHYDFLTSIYSTSPHTLNGHFRVDQ